MEETFRMTLGPDESLKDYEEIFQLIYRRSNFTLDPKSLKLVPLRGTKEDMLETINVLSRGDIYQLAYVDIKIVFKNHSRVNMKKGRSIQGLVNSSPSTTSIKNEIGDMLEDFKSEMKHTFGLQMDTMQIKIKLEEEERSLAIFFPRCTKRHPKNECPLNVIEDCLVCEENHAIEKFPSLPGLKVVYQGVGGGVGSEQLFFINQIKPQGPRPYQQGMQVHTILITIQIRMHIFNLCTLPLIHPSPHLLLGIMLLPILLHLSTILFSHIHPNLLNGEAHHKGGGLKSTITFTIE